MSSMQQLPYMHGVESSNVESMGWKPPSELLNSNPAERGAIGTLYVRFKNGSLGAYEGVPENLFNEGLEADSVGRWLNMRIKKNFKYKKLQ